MPLDIDPGQLRHRVTLQTASTEPDDSGELVETWSSAGDFWALVTPLSGRELSNARQVTPLATHSVIMRNVAAITSAHTLLFSGRTLRLDSVLRMGERNEYYTITATEQVGG
jgi:SPP1 family predicted phage head-tail adaptor